MQHLSKFFTQDDLKNATAIYHLGSTTKGEVIYPQIDCLGMCRTGKIMDYDKEGHRIKGKIDMVDWIHSRLMKKQNKSSSDFHLKQCLFGEHILPKRPNDVACLVEGEKTAIICSMVFPSFVWLSTGGEKMFKKDMCYSLINRNVIVYPDANAVDEWKSKAGDVLADCRSYTFSDWHKNEPQGSKRDIADLILQERKPLEKPTTIGDICQWLDELGIEKGRVTFNF